MERQIRGNKNYDTQGKLNYLVTKEMKSKTKLYRANIEKSGNKVTERI